MTPKQIFTKTARVILTAAFWLGLWWGLAAIVAKPTLLPTPWKVFARLIELAGTAEFYTVTFHSLWNILKGILLAALGGILLAFAGRALPFLRSLLLPVMTVVKSTPVASFIILALIWIGASGVPTFITVLIVLPVVWTNLDIGFSAIPQELDEVARVYRFSPVKRLTALTLPVLRPYFLSACRSSLGLAWKAGIAAEILAMPRGTIGTMIGDAKQYIQTVDVYAWTLTVILLSLLIEQVFSSLFLKAEPNRKKKEVRRHADAT